MSLYTFVNGRKEYIIKPNLFKLTIIPTPSDATVILQSTGFVQHGNHISVPAGSTVNYTLTKAGYEKNTGSIIMSNYERTISVSMSVIQETLLQRYTSGSFEYTIPEKYNYARFVIAGACGGRAWTSAGSGKHPDDTVPGRGAIIEKTITLTSSNRKITGVVGVRPTMTYAAENLGGAGYNNGENSRKKSVTIDYIAGGGGGGSSAIVAGGVIYEADAGGGASHLVVLPDNPNCYGGKGGGVYGGARQTADVSNGNDATTPNAIGYNSGSGYIEIYAGYR